MKCGISKEDLIGKEETGLHDPLNFFASLLFFNFQGASPVTFSWRSWSCLQRSHVCNTDPYQQILALSVAVTDSTIEL